MGTAGATSGYQLPPNTPPLSDKPKEIVTIPVHPAVYVQTCGHLAAHQPATLQLSDDERVMVIAMHGIGESFLVKLVSGQRGVPDDIEEMFLNSPFLEVNADDRTWRFTLREPVNTLGNQVAGGKDRRTES